MNNNLLRIKIMERLNKLASFDYDNLECWQIAEAFNKAQREWFYRQLKGLNLHKEGPESSITMIDDLQMFIKETPLTGVNKQLYFETEVIPGNYIHFMRLTAKADNDQCKDRDMTVVLAEEHNVSQLLSDTLKRPSYEWSETFCTLIGNKIRVYTNDEFQITKCALYYYRTPTDVSFEGCSNPADGSLTTNQESEFKDAVVEVIIDEAVSILAGDIESITQYQRNQGNAQRNT